jgi:PDZ domain
MQIDLWQRRLGWISLVGIILFSGVMAQSKFAAAEDAAAPPPTVAADVVIEGEIAAAPGDKAGEPKEVQIRRPWRYAQADQSLVPLISRLAGATAGLETGKFWIGVECREAQPDLRAQLGLDDGQGLVVVHVAEDSPAAKAGIKQHDVVISAGDAKLGRPQDLVKVVEGTDGKELVLKIFRSGKEKTIQIAPGERPKDKDVVQFLARPGMGMVFAGGPPAPLPDNVSISVSRSGKNPAKISVSRGDEKWDITDQELNKLPDDLRPFVERMVGGGPMTINFQNSNNTPIENNLQRIWRTPQIRIDGQASPPVQPPAPPGQPGQPGAPPQPAYGGGPGSPAGVGGMPGAPGVPQRAQYQNPGTAGDVPPDIGRRLEDIDRQLQRLQEDLRRMRENGPPQQRDPAGQPRPRGREE